jgi:RNA polymerase sigma-70 factor (ECF subfamily)
VTLASAFLDVLDPERRAEASKLDLEAVLGAMVARARTDWPDITADPRQFVAYLAERLPEGAVAPGLASMKTSDLWIACACAAGQARAIAQFERAFFSEVSSAVRRVANSMLSEDDVAQQVREKLFVAQGPTVRPKILEYRGHGPIKAWLRVTASRVALNLATRGPKEKPVDGEWFTRVVSEGEPPEVQGLKARYRADFRAALEAAVDGLEPKDKNVLAYAFSQGLTIDQIGGIYGVHRATAARWIANAQRRLVEETRAALARRLGATQHDIDSIMQLIASRFDVSLNRMLADDEESPGQG